MTEVVLQGEGMSAIGTMHHVEGPRVAGGHGEGTDVRIHRSSPA